MPGESNKKDAGPGQTARTLRATETDIGQVSAEALSQHLAYSEYVDWLKQSAVHAYQSFLNTIHTDLLGERAYLSPFVAWLFSRQSTFGNVVRFKDKEDSEEEPLTASLVYDSFYPLVWTPNLEFCLPVVLMHHREAEGDFRGPRNTHLPPKDIANIHAFNAAWSSRGTQFRDEKREHLSLSETAMRLVHSLEDSFGNKLVLLAQTSSFAANRGPGVRVSTTQMQRLPSYEALAQTVQQVTKRLTETGGELIAYLTFFTADQQARLVGPDQKSQRNADHVEAAEDAALPVRPIDLSDFATIRGAAKELGIDKKSLHRAIDSGRIMVHELPGGTKLVSLSQCRAEWPDGANPVGRPPRRETHDTSSPRLPGHASLETLSSIAEQRLTAELGEFDAKLPASLESRLRRIEQALVELHQPIRHVLHDFIRDINAVPEAERKMSSLDANKRLASTLQRMLTTVGERLCCPSCDSPGTFRCKEGNTKNGVFEFSHSVGESKEGKRSCGGWGSIPILTLVKKS